MPWFRILLWVGSLTLAGLLYYKSVNVKKLPPPVLPGDQFAPGQLDTYKYLQSMKTYQEYSTNVAAINEESRSISQLYFIFIAAYVLLIINCSSNQMNLQYNLTMNNLLRFNIVLAVIVGIVDVFENIVSIYDLDWVTQYITVENMMIGRLIIIGWIVLIWLIAIVSRKIGDIMASAKAKRAQVVVGEE
jgi:hypothetical protein